MPRLAISPAFPRELNGLAWPAHKDVVAAIRRFLAGAPDAPVPERVRHARDPRVVTLRLADGLRAVALREGDLYWFITLLPEDRAWAYARRHRYTVNRAIGVVESWDAEALDEIEPALRRAAAATDRRLLAHVCDDDLLRLGIDPRLLRLVRLMSAESHLAAAEPLLPETQYAPLAVLAAGGGVTAAWRALDARQAVPARGNIDPGDLVAALARSPDQAVFASPGTLERILTRPDWCTFLDPPQHRLAHGNGYPEPVLVTGGAGTGKTLVALHRAAHLARRAEGRVLVVTVSPALATDLSARLDLLIDDEEVRRRVEVAGVDRLACRIVAGAEGRPPRLARVVRGYVSLEAELAGLVAQVRAWLADGAAPEDVAVAARSAQLERAARAALREAGIDVTVTSLHGMKGLELSRVAVIGVADGVVPAPEALTPAEEDAAARAHDLQRERGLLYTACTRTTELLYVSYTGRASPFLPP